MTNTKKSTTNSRKEKPCSCSTRTTKNSSVKTTRSSSSTKSSATKSGSKTRAKSTSACAK